MNRQEVIITIQRTGGTFAHVMGAMFGEDYEAGYLRAVSDMVKLFQKAPIDPTFDAERKAMTGYLKALQSKCEALEAKNKAMHEEVSALNRLIAAMEKKNQKKGKGLFQKG